MKAKEAAPRPQDATEGWRPAGRAVCWSGVVRGHGVVVVWRGVVWWGMAESKTVKAGRVLTTRQAHAPLVYMHRPPISSHRLTTSLAVALHSLPALEPAATSLNLPFPSGRKHMSQTADDYASILAPIWMQTTAH